MKCPYCGSFCADKTLYCPNCKQPLPTADPTKPKEAPVAPPKSRKAVLRRVGMAAVTVVSLCALGIGVYKLWTWIDSYRLTRLYTRGAYTPTIDTVTMPDLRQGHSIAFYGKDVITSPALL